MAPKPLLILNALKEEIPAFYLREAMRSYDSARQVYRLFGREDRIALQTINLPHGYFPDMQSHMLGWFKKWLGMQDSGGPCPLPPPTNYPERKLFCFPGKTRPSDVLSLNGYVSLRARECQTKRRNTATFERSAKLRDLRAILRIPAVCGTGRISTISNSEEDNCWIEKFTIESEPGVLLPCTLIGRRSPPNPGVVITTHPGGKSACLSQPLIQRMLEKGKTLCLVDLRDIGETCWDQPEAALDTAARSALWLGRTMLGNWFADLRAVGKALRARSHGSIELLGFGETSLASLIAAVLDKRISRITAVDMLSTYVIGESAPVMNHSIFVPGILPWGDVSLLAALADCPLSVESLLDPAGKPLSKSDLSAWSREVRQLKAKLHK